MTERIPVSPPVLAWARTSAGLEQGAAAKRLGVRPEALAAWEDGSVQPTIAQLRNAAKLYRRPLAVLLLPDPPKDFDAMRDFRKVEESGRAWSPAMHAEYRRALTQREVMLELAEVSPDSIVPSNALPKLNPGAPEAAGASLRQFLGVSINQQQRARDQSAALNLWVSATEARGVLVIQTDGIERTEMRGFSISEWPYPVAALNGSEWPRPKTFTLLHELAHLALNLGGLCDLHEPRRKTSSHPEHVCNAIAASALLPADTLLAETSVASAAQNHRWTLEDLSLLSLRYGVSAESILLRLVSLEKATWAGYWTLKEQLEAEYEEARRRREERQRASEGGPSYYVIKARDLGHGYASSVIDAMHSRRISGLDAANYLDIRYSQLAKLEGALT